MLLTYSVFNMVRFVGANSFAPTLLHLLTSVIKLI